MAAFVGSLGTWAGRAVGAPAAYALPATTRSRSGATPSTPRPYRRAASPRPSATMMAPPPGGPDKSPPRPTPTVAVGDSTMDIYSRLAQDRILLLGSAVDDDVANQLVAQLLFLAAEDPDKDITIYINSPGGSVTAGLAIYDTMQFIPCDIRTICFGTAASMGAFLLSAGTKGKRKSLPNARIMIHQPSGGAQGQAADLAIQAGEIVWIRELMNGYMAQQTGQSIDKVTTDTDRDYFMTPAEAVAYGLIDEVIETKTPTAIVPKTIFLNA